MNAFGVKPANVTNLPGIYLILSNSGYYIGSSIDMRDRMRSHSIMLKKNKHGNIFLQRVYNKHGNLRFVPFKVFAKNPNWSKEQLESIVRSEEQRLLSQCVNCKNCMNLRFDVTAAPDTRISIVSFDRSGNSEEFSSSRAAGESLGISYHCISKILKGKSNVSKGFTFFYENSINKNWKEKFGVKGRGSKSRIVATHKNGKILEFDSQIDASKALGIKNQSINRILKGGRKTSGGYKFSYL